MNMTVKTNKAFTYYYFNDDKFKREKAIADKLGNDIRITQVFINGTWKDYTTTSIKEISSDDNILIAKGDNLKVRTNV